MSETEETFDFDLEFQTKALALMARDSSFANHVKDLVKPQYFSETSSGTLSSVILDFVKTYRSAPDKHILPTLIKDAIASKRIRKDEVSDVVDLAKKVLSADISNPKFVTDKIADFARRQAIQDAMMQSLGYLDKGQFDKIQDVMSKALKVGVSVDQDDYDYFEEIANRTTMRQDILAGKIVKRGITTGYSGLDCYLYHNGWGRKELSCIMGPAKSGKSLSLGDFGKNASLAGFNVLYDSLEVSKQIIAERIDANLADTIMRDLTKNYASVEAAVRAAHAKAGAFKFADYPSGTMKPSALHRQLERYRSDGLNFDLVIVDYADIMAAEYRSDNLIENLRTIYIDLRAIAHEMDCALLTATQTNREGAKAVTAKATDIGDDWNKARTVDILIGLNATDAEKAKGIARLYWALSRNTEDGFTIEIQQNREKMQFLTKILGRK